MRHHGRARPRRRRGRRHHKPVLVQRQEIPRHQETCLGGSAVAWRNNASPTGTGWVLMRDNLERGMPAAIEAEHSILGAILLDNKLAHEALSAVRAEHFSL